MAGSPPEIPFTDHSTEVLARPLTTAVNCWVCSSATEAFVGVTTTAGCVITLVSVLALLLGSATLVAVTVMLLGCGAAAGAVNTPAEVIVPQGLPEPAQPTPPMVQVICVFGFEPGSGVTVAINCAVAAGFRLAGPLTERVKWLVMTKPAMPVFDESASLVAVTVTVGGVGKIPGAV